MSFGTWELSGSLLSAEADRDRDGRDLRSAEAAAIRAWCDQWSPKKGALRYCSHRADPLPADKLRSGLASPGEKSSSRFPANDTDSHIPCLPRTMENTCAPPILHHQPAIGSADTIPSKRTRLHLGTHQPFRVRRAGAGPERLRITPTKTLRAVLPKSPTVSVALHSLSPAALWLLYSSVQLTSQHS